MIKLQTIELSNFFILRQQLDQIFIANIEKEHKIEKHILLFFPCQINLCLGTYTILSTKLWEAGTYYECACKQYLKILKPLFKNNYWYYYFDFIKLNNHNKISEIKAWNLNNHSIELLLLLYNKYKYDYPCIKLPPLLDDDQKQSYILLDTLNKYQSIFYSKHVLFLTWENILESNRTSLYNDNNYYWKSLTELCNEFTNQKTVILVIKTLNFKIKLNNNAQEYVDIACFKYIIEKLYLSESPLIVFSEHELVNKMSDIKYSNYDIKIEHYKLLKNKTKSIEEYVNKKILSMDIWEKLIECLARGQLIIDSINLSKNY